MRKRITGKEILNLTILSSFVSILIFMMIEVLFAQTLRDYLSDHADNPNLIIFIIITGGLLLSLIISILGSFLSINKRLKKYAYFASLFAFALTYITIIIISYAFIIIYYPDVIVELSTIEKIIHIYTYIIYISIYGLSSPVLLWVYAQFLYSIYFALFLYLFNKKTNRRIIFMGVDL